VCEKRARRMAQESGCCSEFEACVGCCVQPERNAARKLTSTPRGANKVRC
jgi:hypothetical protein